MRISRFLITTSLSLALLLSALAPVMAESVGHGSFEKDKANNDFIRDSGG